MAAFSSDNSGFVVSEDILVALGDCGDRTSEVATVD
jgi:hypothetical protein